MQERNIKKHREMSLRSLIALFLFQIVSSNPYLPLPISGASNEQSRLFNYIYNLLFFIDENRLRKLLPELRKFVESLCKLS